MKSIAAPSLDSSTRIRNRGGGRWRALEAQGFTVYRGWHNVPNHLVSATRARKEKLPVSKEPAAYVLSGDSANIYALFEVLKEKVGPP